jgi:hypothetical protein
VARRTHGARRCVCFDIPDRRCGWAMSPQERGLAYGMYDGHGRLFCAGPLAATVIAGPEPHGVAYWLATFVSFGGRCYVGARSNHPPSAGA